MKLASFIFDGVPSYGVVRDDQVVDCGPALRKAHPTLRALVAAGALGELQRVSEGAGHTARVTQTTFLPAVSDPERIVCLGLNYRAHAEEAGLQVSKNPEVFIRLRSTLVGHGQPLIIPKVSHQLDYEGELAIVIGKGGRYITKEDAMEHVLGYACFNDGSVRDFQFEHHICVGKNFPGTGGFGPWITTRDELPDISRCVLTTSVNGTELQHAELSLLVRDVATMVSYVSQFTRLEPGDVIPTGTPKGVGFARKPQLWLRPGDTVEVAITGIGTLRHPVRAEEGT
jgi:2-keto-4-pentenoate hydratase/2-oxohepta-3-ene-1,7-dioic acid hydratase in catechol pathway